MADEEATPKEAETSAATKVLARNWSTFDQWLQHITNLDPKDTREYQKMVRTDETVSCGIEFTALTCMSRLGEYRHRKPRIEKFIRRNLKTLKGGWKKALRQILETALVAGFSASEKVWAHEEIGGTLRWVIWKLITLNPKDVVFKLNLEGGLQHGDVEQVIQHYGCGTQKEARIPREKAVLYSHREEYQDPFGHSRLGPAWKNWFLKDVMLKAWGGAPKRFSSPIAVAKSADTESFLQGEQSQKPRGQVILEMLLKISGGGGMVLNPQEEVEFFELAGGVGDDFQGCIDHLNRMIFRALLIPALLMDAGETGSQSLGEKHWDIFLESIEGLLDEFEPVLIEDLIKPLIVYNFGEQENEDYGGWKRKPIEPSNLEILARAFYSMTNVGYMTPAYEPDMDAVRAKLGLEDATPEELIAATKARNEALMPPVQDAGNEVDPNHPDAPPDRTKDKSAGPGIRKNGERGAGGKPGHPRPSSKVPTRKSGGRNQRGATPMNPQQKTGKAGR